MSLPLYITNSLLLGILLLHRRKHIPMRVKSCTVDNFASYEHLEFDFQDQGLTLIQGPTGSGKSTLCDIIPWVLFGRTAKGGAVTEVLSWPGDKSTSGTLRLSRMTVTRTRGPKPKDNDLSFCPNDGVVTRGKDIPDTQKLINQALGFDIDLYLAGAYLHEFSQTTQFFTTTAKHRRALCEQIADLKLPVELQDKIAFYKKENQTHLEVCQSKISAASKALEYLNTRYDSDFKKSTEWAEKFEAKLTFLKIKADNFEDERKNKLDNLYTSRDVFETRRSENLVALEGKIKTEMSFIRTPEPLAEKIKILEAKEAELAQASVCTHCGGNKENHALNALLKAKHDVSMQLVANTQHMAQLDRLIREKKEVKATENIFDARIAALTESTNIHLDLAKAHIQEKNPYLENLYDLTAEIQHTAAELSLVRDFLVEVKMETGDLVLLDDIIADFRSVIVKNTIVDIEANTNRLLEKHFDAELRVEFEVQDADKIEVTITKDGNQCVFTQLSKGQRQMLKLAFGVSVMRCVSNHHGLWFNCLFLDEVLDGCDDTVRLKGVRMLEEIALNHESVFLVEHSEAVKAMIDNKYTVSLTNGRSELEEA